MSPAPSRTQPRPRVRAAGAARVAALVLAAPVLLGGCGSDDAPLTSNEAGRTVLVEAFGEDCQLSKRGSPAGEVTFTVRNSGDGPVTFAVLAADQAELGGTRVGGGKVRDLVVELPVGDLSTACTVDGRAEPVTTDFVVSEGDTRGGY